MGRFIIIILDGFGIGEMPDVPLVRPQDEGANTWRHIAQRAPGLSLPTLAKLGLANIAGFETENIHYGPYAVFGKAMLMHEGADTFFGHQEIMGTHPRRPFMEPIKNKLDAIVAILEANGHKVDFSQGDKERFMTVDGSVTVADNIECDPGLAFNVIAALDDIDFRKALAIGRLVRQVSTVPRVIVFGGRGVHLEDMLAAVEENGEYIGVNAPGSGIYREDYHCIHLGYGVDPKTQVPTILGKAGVPVFLLGKVADVVRNDSGTSISTVDTKTVLEQTEKFIAGHAIGFFCTNVQETDLAGHQENPALYAKTLAIADAGIEKVIARLSKNDILVVMADHGNDPTIGHPHHNREMVPMMVHCRALGPIGLGTRKTLSDVGASAAEYFGAHTPENGASFLKDIGCEPGTGVGRY